MSDLDLDAIRARADAATPGPWVYRGKSSIVTPPIDVDEANWGPYPEGLDGGYELRCMQDEGAWRRADSEFIAHAREDIPALLDALEQERARAERAEAECEVCVELRGRDRGHVAVLEARVAGLTDSEARAQELVAGYEKALSSIAEGREAVPGHVLAEIAADALAGEEEGGDASSNDERMAASTDADDGGASPSASPLPLTDEEPSTLEEQFLASMQARAGRFAEVRSIIHTVVNAYAEAPVGPDDPNIGIATQDVVTFLGRELSARVQAAVPPSSPLTDLRDRIEDALTAWFESVGSANADVWPFLPGGATDAVMGVLDGEGGGVARDNRPSGYASRPAAEGSAPTPTCETCGGSRMVVREAPHRHAGVVTMLCPDCEGG